MLTGRQLREARKLLRWSREELSRKSSVVAALVAAIESTDGAAWLTEKQEDAIRRACEAAGVRFGVDDVKLQKAGP